MKRVMIVFAVATLYACATKKSNANTNDASYGYTEKNPVKVGGVMNGPVNERNFLNSLSGPNGELVSFHRRGSCCPFDTKNSPFGGGMLDTYAVYYEGIKDTATLYINMYDQEKVKAPVGFQIKN